MNLYKILDRIGFRGWLTALYRVEIAGAERIPARGGVVIASSHDSLVDPWLLNLATPRQIRYMAKAELWNNRAVGWAMDAFGTFPIERGAGDLSAMSAGVDLLRQGEVLGIFPQGTSKQLERRPFHRGAARLALATGTPVVPVGIVDNEYIHRRGGIRFPRVRISVGEAIAVGEGKPTIKAARELTDRIEREIVELRR